MHERATAPQSVARFRRIDLDMQHAHHDALEFADGTIVPLTRVLAGQHATVLQTPHLPMHEPMLDALDKR
jgi:hypothetical protein